MSGFTPEEIKAHQSDLEGIAGWSEEGLRWHEYLLSFAARWGQQPISSQAPLSFIDTLLKRQETDLNAANQLLEQTIEVLEGRFSGRGCISWTEVAPLLDNLKALKKEGTE